MRKGTAGAGGEEAEVAEQLPLNSSSAPHTWRTAAHKGPGAAVAGAGGGSRGGKVVDRGRNEQQSQQVCLAGNIADGLLHRVLQLQLCMTKPTHIASTQSSRCHNLALLQVKRLPLPPRSLKPPGPTNAHTVAHTWCSRCVSKKTQRHMTSFPAASKHPSLLRVNPPTPHAHMQTHR